MSAGDALNKAHMNLQAALLECASVVGSAFSDAFRQQGSIIHEEMTRRATPYKADAPTGQKRLP